MWAAVSEPVGRRGQDGVVLCVVLWCKMVAALHAYPDLARLGRYGA